MRVSASFLGVGGDRLVGFEVPIALDGKVELAAHYRYFDEADISQLGTAKPEIAESEGESAVGIELLGSVPGPRPPRLPKGCSKRLLPF
jgi:hypothetical protein